MDYDLAAQLITRYISAMLKEPQDNIPRAYFERRVYSKWAADELLTQVMDNPYEDAFDVIELYILELECCIYAAGDSPNRRIFKIAKEVAEDILDYLLKS